MSPRSIRRASITSCSAVSRLDPPDRAQVQPQRVEARLDRQVELDGLLARARRPVGVGRRRAAPRRCRLRARQPPVGLDDLDPLLVEVGVQLLDLLLGDLDLLEACGDLLEGQKAALLPLRDQPAELIELRDRCLVTEQKRLP